MELRGVDGWMNGGYMDGWTDGQWMRVWVKGWKEEGLDGMEGGGAGWGGRRRPDGWREEGLDGCREEALMQQSCSLPAGTAPSR